MPRDTELAALGHIAQTFAIPCCNSNWQACTHGHRLAACRRVVLISSFSRYRTTETGTFQILWMTQLYILERVPGTGGTGRALRFGVTRCIHRRRRRRKIFPPPWGPIPMDKVDRSVLRIQGCRRVDWPLVSAFLASFGSSGQFLSISRFFQHPEKAGTFRPQTRFQ